MNINQREDHQRKVTLQCAAAILFAIVVLPGARVAIIASDDCGKPEAIAEIAASGFSVGIVGIKLGMSARQAAGEAVTSVRCQGVFLEFRE